MGKRISIGKQDYASLREGDYFWIDKTGFIREWWESGDEITLITRPRRFGKTLNMSMLNCFFSEKYAGRSELFEGLLVWTDEKYRKLQGTYPVIFISFADVKQTNYADAVQKIKNILIDAYRQYAHLAMRDELTIPEKQQFAKMQSDMSDVEAQDALKNLSGYLYRCYGKKAIILLDEYDTPLQEAYVHGYWDTFADFIRSLFNAAFKTNPNLERAVMTGITRISKESIFSDLNNLKVITTTSEAYADCFGFTEPEVFDALAQYGLDSQKEAVKSWYDGFTFGKKNDIYNPWSITNFLDQKQLRPYWAATSSNGLVNKLIRTASADVKSLMEELLQGNIIAVNFDEQIVFNQLDQEENAIWSLLLAGGYLRAEEVEYRGIYLEPWYHLRITNLETSRMFSEMFKGWFGCTQSNYNRFVKGLLHGDIEAMNHYMNEVALATFSYFDTGKTFSETGEPERFYHGFVLGLMAELQDRYEIRSNRESGFGRYDVMMIPRKEKQSRLPAIVIEFKVQNQKKEQTLEQTAESALRQIREQNYNAELLERGMNASQIVHYGFAFQGKNVLIASEDAGL